MIGRITLAALSLFMLSGCGIIPKPVEYFQDEVEAVPEMGAKANETLKQAAKLAHEKAKETELRAIETEADESVRIPARDVAVLTEAVSDRVGEPKQPAKLDDVDRIIARMDKQEALFDAKLEAYRKEILENVGKKIEGSGKIQVGYFTNLLFLVTLAFGGFIMLRVISTLSPEAKVLINGAQATAGLVGQGLSEVIDAGEAFKDRLIEEVPESADRLKKIFRETHERYQSAETQQLVSRATKRKR